MMGIFLAFFSNLHQFKIFYSFVNEQVMIRTHAGRNEKWCQFVTAMINHVQYLTIVIFYFKSSQIGLSLLKASLFFFHILIVSIWYRFRCLFSQKIYMRRVNYDTKRPNDRPIIKFLDKIWWHHHWCETSKSATCASLADEIISLND